MDLSRLEKIILESSKRSLRDNLLAIYAFDEQVSCPKNKFSDLLEASFLIVTNKFVEDLYSLRESILSELSSMSRDRVNLDVIPKNLFLNFYREGIYPVINAIKNGKQLYGGEFFNFLRNQDFNVSKLSINYLFCKSIYRLNYVKESAIKGRISSVFRHAFYSIKYSILALLLHEEKIVLNCWAEILEELRIKNNELKNIVIEAMNSLFKTINSNLNSRAKTIKPEMLEVFNLLEIPLSIIYKVWYKVHKEKLKSICEIIGIIKKKEPNDIEFACLDDKPTMILYYGLKEERIELI